MKLFNVFKKTYAAWRNDQVSRIAAALAYYTAFSMAPLIIISISISGFFFGQSKAEDELFGKMSKIVGKEGVEQIQTIVHSSAHESNGIFALVGVVILLIGATGVFAELQSGVNTIWGVKARPNRSFKNFIHDRFLSLTMVVSVAFLLIVSLVVSTVISALSSYLNQYLIGAEIIWWLVNVCISLFVVTLFFALIFKYLPDVQLTWGDVWLGAFLTAILFTIGKFILEIYIATAKIASAYGAAGALIVILVWVFYSAQILFFGVEFTKVRCAYAKNKIKLKKGAVWAK